MKQEMMEWEWYQLERVQIIFTSVETYYLITNRLYAVLYFGYTVVERRSLTGELSLSCTRPAADG